MTNMLTKYMVKGIGNWPFIISDIKNYSVAENAKCTNEINIKTQINNFMELTFFLDSYFWFNKKCHFCFQRSVALNEN